MSTLYLWKVKCASDTLYYKVWSEDDTEPTICPDNSDHGVVEGSGFIVKTLREDNPRLNQEDGRMIIAPVIHPDYMNPYHTSSGDDYENGTRGDGEFMSYCFTYDGTNTVHTKTIRFVDFIHIIGGKMHTMNANTQDYFSFEAKAPATPVTVSSGYNGSDYEQGGSGNGNVNRIDVSGGYHLAHLLIPAALDGTNYTGTHNVDLTEPMNENLAGPNPILITKAVPVPAYKSNGRDPDGFWTWNELTGAITPSPNQDGFYNLYDFQIDLSRYVNKLAVGLSQDTPNQHYYNDFTIFHRSGPVLPHWEFIVYMTTANTHTVGDKVCYNLQLIMGRRKSV